MLVLQQLHSLYYFELEKQYINRVSFRKFLGFSDHIPYRTKSGIRKKIIDNSKEKEI